jgi:acyl-homoserine-lactone acylase
MTWNKKKAFFYLLLAVALLVVLIALVFIVRPLVNYGLGRSLDEPRGRVTLAGLKQPATIRRDRLGTPLVEAGNMNDLFFATGYAMASDRLWQMTVMKMAAQGRMAEILGCAALETDVLMRTVDIARFAERSWRELSAEERNLFQRFAEGVNAYLQSHEYLPIEFDSTVYRPEPWQPRDSLCVFGLLNFTLAANLPEELAFLVFAQKFGANKAAYLFPSHPDEALPFAEAGKLGELELKAAGGDPRPAMAAVESLRELVAYGGAASNNWAFAGSRTRSGKSIVANDTHLFLTVPSAWMIMHMKAPGYDAAGLAIPGLPLIMLGFNGRLAWGATMVMADSQDIFLEKLQQRGGKTCYRYRDRCRALQQRDERFAVRGGRTKVKTIRSTVHGPLLEQALHAFDSMPQVSVPPLPFESRYGLALRWSMADGERGTRGLLRMGQARNMAEARQALRLVDSIYLNIVYGDADNIGWQVTGRLPLRGRGTGHLPSPGWTGEYDWQGYLPFEQKPYTINPDDGFLATANNRTTGSDSAHPISHSWVGPARIDRIRQLAGNRSDLTVAYVNRMQKDRLSLMARDTQKLLFRGDVAAEVARIIYSWKDEGKRRDARSALELLRPEKFDCVMDEGSAAAALMGAFHHCFTRRVFLDELGPDDGLDWQSFTSTVLDSYAAPEDHLLVREQSPFFDDVNTKAVEGKADMLALSLADAWNLCRQRMGRDENRWKWGEFHTYSWKHPFAEQFPWLFGFLSRGPLPAGGDLHTVNVSGYHWGRDFDALLIPAARLVVDFGLEEPAVLITHGGQSGDPASPHYDDMIQPWVKVRYHPLPFRPKNLARQYRDLLRLEPL